MSGQAIGASCPMARDSGSQNTREAVGHADAQVDAKRRRRHQPAIEAGLGNRVLTIKKFPRRRRLSYQQFQQ